MWWWLAPALLACWLHGQLLRTDLMLHVVERKEKIAVIGRTCGQSLLAPNDYFFGNLFHYNARDRRFCFPECRPQLSL